MGTPQAIPPSTWAEIDLEAIRHNVRQIRRLAVRNTFYLPTRAKSLKSLPQPMDILAVVKADAYGHGSEKVAALLDQEGIQYFGVSDAGEGVRLRGIGIEKPILLFESTLPQYVPFIVDHQLTPTVCTWEFARALNRCAGKGKKKAAVHIKVDTGMGRLGIWHTEAFDFIRAVGRLEHVVIEGIYTHFPSADTHRRFTQRQIDQLNALVLRLDQSGLIVPLIHAANSMGLAGYKTHVLNLARPGLMLYGLYPSPKLKKEIALKPALTVKSKIIFLKRIERGRSISYGRTFIATQSMTVATIPLGYNDGYPRGLSNKARVLVDGILCPVIGRVTMDQTVIDVSKVNAPRLDMPVVVLGTQKGKTILADDLARDHQTINYEIACSLGNRLPRRYV